MRVRRALVIFPLIFPIAFHALYQPINAAWTVTRFGCGCPPVRDTGAFHFNANHFNMILWLAVSVACALTWWRLLRSEFTDRTSTRYMVTQRIGCGVLLCICASRLGKEIWL